MSANSKFYGKSPVILDLLEQARCISHSDSNVLITGEYSVGKETLAKHIHSIGNRSHIPLTKMYLPGFAGVNENDLYRYLFGTSGIIKRANGGTLFLNEVSKIPLVIQDLLANFIEQKKIVGDGGPQPIDVRIISSTAENLEDMIDKGKFQFELYKRLNDVELYIPPLKERREDIGELLQYFGKVHGIKIGSQAMRELRVYNWPGNVRELESKVENLAAHFGQQTITPARLPDKKSEWLDHSAIDNMYERMTVGNESFWDVVFPDFMNREITKQTLCGIIERGLDYSRGDYGTLLDLFNMKSDERNRFTRFLKKHDCYLEYKSHRRHRKISEQESRMVS